MSKKNSKAWKPKIPYSAMRACSPTLELRSYSTRDFPEWRAAYLAQRPKQNAFDDKKRKPEQLTRALFKKRISGQRRRASNRTHFVFPIFHRKTGTQLGLVDFFVLNRELRWGNLGYSVHNTHWRQGIATEAAKLALKLAFGPLALHRLEACCEPKNLASQKVARNCGLRPEGIRKKFFSEKGGVDMMVFAENAIDYKRKQRHAR